MAFVTLEIRIIEIAVKLAKLDAAGFELLQCLPHKSNFGEAGDDAVLFCIFGPKTVAASGNGGGTSMALMGPFDKGGDDFHVPVDEVSGIEQVSPTKTKIFTSDGRSHTVTETVADVVQAYNDAL